MVNLNIQIEKEARDQLKMIALASNKAMNQIVSEIMMMGIKEYKKKYGDGNNGK